MPHWYEINAKSDDAAEVVIAGPIGASWDGEGTTARQFIADFRAIKAKNVTLTVNSPGGSLFDGFAIYNAIASSGKNVVARVMGLAASAASLIVMAAKRIEMPKNAHMMIHKSGGGVYGNADDMRDMAAVLDTLDASMTRTYAARSGKTEDEVRAMLDKGDVWMTADEAVAAGFADVATDLVKATANYSLDKLPEKVRAAFEQGPQPAAKPPAPPLTSRVVALAKAAGLEVVALSLAANPKVVDEASAQAAIADALEIKALADLAHRPTEAEAFIRAGKSVAEVRAELHERDAAEARTQIINTAPPATSLNKPAATADLNIGQLWGKINAMTGGSKQQ